MDSYKIKMRINTLSAFVNQAMNIATVDVKVLDKNDNTPRYVVLIGADPNENYILLASPMMHPTMTCLRKSIW